jgi:Asp/Glu/hydantoin racemase
MSNQTPIRLWFQLLSAQGGMTDSIAATQRACDMAASLGTTVEVRGTRHGALGDQYKIFMHYDVREVVDNGLKMRAEKTHDAFVIANSLDPALVELREMLDVPVLSFMEVACFTACQMGETFGLVLVNDRFTPHYTDIVRSYGLTSRLTGTEPVRFDNIRRLNDAFTDDKVGAELMEQLMEACRRLIARGAEVIIPAGPQSALLALRGIFQIDGVPILNSYGLLVKAAEVAVAMHRMTGVAVSRKRRYQSPPDELIRQCAQVRGIDSLRNG